MSLPGRAGCTRSFVPDAFSRTFIAWQIANLTAETGAVAPAGSVADTHDNDATAEALNDTFKAELIEPQGPRRDPGQVERAALQWVTRHNEERLRSTLDYVPPAE
ncbi:transposase [Streptomyces sp. SID625]|nr:transposase [Streptomyces sp. SID625]